MKTTTNINQEEVRTGDQQQRPRSKLKPCLNLKNPRIFKEIYANFSCEISDEDSTVQKTFWGLFRVSVFENLYQSLPYE